MIPQLLKTNGAILISSWANIVYLTSFSGFSTTERECFLLLTKNEKYLITDKRYSEAIKQKIKDFEIIDTGAVNFIQNDDLNILKKINSVGIEESDIKLSEYKSLKHFIKKINTIDLSDLRLIKNKTEIEKIKKACKIADKTFEKIIKEIKIGITEKEISNKIEQLIKEEGAEISFSPIVAFGKNSAIPHHLSGKIKLKKNQIVLLDFGAKVDNYCSDMSRTFFFGKASDKFKKIYLTVLGAQNKSIEIIESELKNNKKIIAKNIDLTARSYIQDKGFPTIPHSVGHGIGIEVHEAPYISPRTKTIIKPGMIFSIEPGIYDPSFGGVRIEDLILIKENNIELLSQSKKGIIEIDV